MSKNVKEKQYKLLGNLWKFCFGFGLILGILTTIYPTPQRASAMIVLGVLIMGISVFQFYIGIEAEQENKAGRDE